MIDLDSTSKTEYDILIFIKDLVESEDQIPDWAEFFARKGDISVVRATELITKFLKL